MSALSPPLDLLVTTGRVIARSWPALLAWFLAGWTIRLLLIQLAGGLGNDSGVVGFLVLSLAVLVRLASYVGMFLVVRSGLAHFERLDAAAGESAPRRSFAQRWGQTVFSGILPFFLIYAAWGMIQDDLTAYGAASIDQFDAGTDDPGAAFDVPVSVISIGLVAAAFVLRLLLQRFASKLPQWTGVFAVYLEAVWVFVAVLLVRTLLADVPQWFATRRMFAWAVDGWAELRESFAWVRGLGDVIAWLSVQFGEVIAQPLAWLALAAIVLIGALPGRASRAAAGRTGRLRSAASDRWSRLSPRTRRLLLAPVNGVVERWQPIATAAGLIWRAGPIAMGSYVLAFTLIGVGAEWLRLVVWRLIGPHDFGWWSAADQPLALLIDAVVFPLQVCVVAAAFDLCLRRLDEEVTTPAAELAELLPDPAPRD
jgi:hypothetical protein